MWLKTRNDRLINLDHVREISARDKYLMVAYADDGRHEVVCTYADEESATRGLSDLTELIIDTHSIPFADNNVVFEL